MQANISAKREKEAYLQEIGIHQNPKEKPLGDGFK